MKTVTVDPGTLFASDPKSPPMVCWQCLRQSARWHVGRSPNDQPMCGFCFLYKTEWGKQNSEKVLKLIHAVELNMGRTISNNGKVLEEEADRIVMSIRFASGLPGAMRKLARSK